MLKKSLVALALTLYIAFGAISVLAASKTTRIKIEGMHCGGCASSVAKKLKATPGVESVEVSFENKEAVVIYDDKKTNDAKLREAVASTGFKVIAE